MQLAQRGDAFRLANNFRAREAVLLVKDMEVGVSVVSHGSGVVAARASYTNAPSLLDGHH